MDNSCVFIIHAVCVFSFGNIVFLIEFGIPTWSYFSLNCCFLLADAVVSIHPLPGRPAWLISAFMALDLPRNPVEDWVNAPSPPSTVTVFRNRSDVFIFLQCWASFALGMEWAPEVPGAWCEVQSTLPTLLETGEHMGHQTSSSLGSYHGLEVSLLSWLLSASVTTLYRLLSHSWY